MNLGARLFFNALIRKRFSVPISIAEEEATLTKSILSYNFLFFKYSLVSIRLCPFIFIIIPQKI